MAAMDYKSFFCRGSDAPAVKKLKIEMLTAVADDVNTYDIVSELCEYVTDVDAVIAREGVRAVGRIALDGDQNVAGIVDRLLQFIEYNQEHITAETLVQVKDLVRKHPRWIDQCVVAVSGIELETIVEPEAKAALVYIYGEYGQAMPEAPYMLEPLLDEFDEEESEEVRLELLASAMKLFFKRAPEMRDMLGKALAAGTNDANQDVHDRALMYARLLHKDPEAASRVIAGYKESVANFSDGAGFADKFGEQIFDEFNSLSVLYRKPAFLFTDDKPVEVPRTPDVIEAAGDGGGGSAMMGDSLIDFGDEPVGASSSRSAIDDLLGTPAGGGGGGGGEGVGEADRGARTTSWTCWTSRWIRRARPPRRPRLLRRWRCVRLRRSTRLRFRLGGRLCPPRRVASRARASSPSARTRRRCSRRRRRSCRTWRRAGSRRWPAAALRPPSSTTFTRRRRMGRVCFWWRLS